ncbi:MAG: MBL fold metallo-hydrolase [Planctomycetota bacterium]|jgi:glyoxylase-like metal-dependent hydrolase (beta-lactamase superfamily II)
MLIRNPPVQVSDYLWMLGTDAYPLYLIRGEVESAIVEGGVGSMGPLVLEQMDQLAMPKDAVRLVIITHAHPDHVMAVPLFREAFPGIAVLASEIAAKTLSAEKAVSFFCQIDDALTGSLTEAGLITGAHRPKHPDDMRITVDRALKEGDTVAVDGITLEVLETPGHSDCSLSFHDPQAGVLLISDATGYYMPEHDAWWPCYFTGYGAYVESIKRLAGLGAEILCLSHNGVVRGADDVAAYLAGALAATEGYHRRIVDEAKSGKSVREIAEVLGSEIHEKTPLLPVDFFQKNCGILVKQSLKHEGITPDK